MNTVDRGYMDGLVIQTSNLLGAPCYILLSSKSTTFKFYWKLKEAHLNNFFYKLCTNLVQSTTKLSQSPPVYSIKKKTILLTSSKINKSD